MARRGRCGRRSGSGSCLAAVCTAFGAGLLISCLFSLKLAVIVAAVLLVCIGCSAG